MWRAVVLLLMLASPVMAQTPTPEVKKSLRDFLEPEIAKQAEEAIAGFMREATARGNANHPDLAIGVNGIKMLVYNTAYAQYRCMLEKLQTQISADACFRKAVAELYASYKIVTEYAAQVAPRSKRYELETRLFEAELEFPPYKFLESDGAHLFDHARLAACLRK